MSRVIFLQTLLSILCLLNAKVEAAQPSLVYLPPIDRRPICFSVTGKPADDTERTWLQIFQELEREGRQGIIQAVKKHADGRPGLVFHCGKQWHTQENTSLLRTYRIRCTNGKIHFLDEQGNEIPALVPDHAHVEQYALPVASAMPDRPAMLPPMPGYPPYPQRFPFVQPLFLHSHPMHFQPPFHLPAPGCQPAQMMPFAPYQWPPLPTSASLGDKIAYLEYHLQFVQGNDRAWALQEHARLCALAQQPVSRTPDSSLSPASSAHSPRQPTDCSEYKQVPLSEQPAAAPKPSERPSPAPFAHDDAVNHAAIEKLAPVIPVASVPTVVSREPSPALPVAPREGAAMPSTDAADCDSSGFRTPCGCPSPAPAEVLPVATPAKPADQAQPIEQNSMGGAHTTMPVQPVQVVDHRTKRKPRRVNEEQERTHQAETAAAQAEQERHQKMREEEKERCTRAKAKKQAAQERQAAEEVKRAKEIEEATRQRKLQQEAAERRSPQELLRQGQEQQEAQAQQQHEALLAELNTAHREKRFVDVVRTLQNHRDDAAFYIAHMLAVVRAIDLKAATAEEVIEAVSNLLEQRAKGGGFAVHRREDRRLLTKFLLTYIQQPDRREPYLKHATEAGDIEPGLEWHFKQMITCSQTCRQQGCPHAKARNFLKDNEGTLPDSPFRYATALLSQNCHLSKAAPSTAQKIMADAERSLGEVEYQLLCNLVPTEYQQQVAATPAAPPKTAKQKRQEEKAAELARRTAILTQLYDVILLNDCEGARLTFNRYLNTCYEHAKIELAVPAAVECVEYFTGNLRNAIKLHDHIVVLIGIQGVIHYFDNRVTVNELRRLINIFKRIPAIKESPDPLDTFGRNIQRALEHIMNDQFVGISDLLHSFIQLTEPNPSTFRPRVFRLFSKIKTRDDARVFMNALHNFKKGEVAPFGTMIENCLRAYCIEGSVTPEVRDQRREVWGDYLQGHPARTPHIFLARVKEHLELTWGVYVVLRSSTRADAAQIAFNQIQTAEDVANFIKALDAFNTTQDKSFYQAMVKALNTHYQRKKDDTAVAAQTRLAWHTNLDARMKALEGEGWGCVVQ